jgi:hypothetical protein
LSSSAVDLQGNIVRGKGEREKCDWTEIKCVPERKGWKPDKTLAPWKSDYAVLNSTTVCSRFLSFPVFSKLIIIIVVVVNSLFICFHLLFAISLFIHCSVFDWYKFVLGSGPWKPNRVFRTFCAVDLAFHVH